MISFVVVSLFDFVLNTVTDLMLIKVNRWMNGIKLFVVHWEDINEKKWALLLLLQTHTNMRNSDKPMLPLKKCFIFAIS